MFLNCPAYMDNDGATRCGLPAEVGYRYIMQLHRRAAGKRQDQLPARPPLQWAHRMPHRARAGGRDSKYQPARRHLRPFKARTAPIEGTKLGPGDRYEHLPGHGCAACSREHRHRAGVADRRCVGECRLQAGLLTRARRLPGGGGHGGPRFRLAEGCGTLAAIGGFAAGYLAAGSLLAAAWPATLCEVIGFYGCVGVRTAAAGSPGHRPPGRVPQAGRRTWHAVTQQLASCAAAEALEGLPVRPGCLAWCCLGRPGRCPAGYGSGSRPARRSPTWPGTAWKPSARRGVARPLAVRQPA